jgi:zinc and cadmium transporter
MTTYLWVLLFTIGGSLLSVAAAATYLLLPYGARARSLEYLVSFAIGMLLGAAFLHLLPEALEHGGGSAQALMTTALVAILTFFLLEKGLVWRHHHQHAHDVHAHGHAPAGTLILIGDSFHNFLDGVLVAAAFLADFHVGLVTALAVIAHEIPQELGDFAILLHSGYSRARAFAFNLLTSLMMILGATLAWFALASIERWIPYVLAFTAASFIYVAVSDLMPTLNRRLDPHEIGRQLALIGAGLAFNLLVHRPG